MIVQNPNRHAMLWGGLNPAAPECTSWADLHMMEFRKDRRNTFRNGLRNRMFEPSSARFYFWAVR